MIHVDIDTFSETMTRKLRDEPVLYAVQYALTYRCNVACVHCYAEGADRGAPPELAPEEVRYLFRQFAELGCLHCTVTGGEPLVRPDFDSIWSAIAEQGVRRLLFTNATLVDRRKADFLKQLPPDWVEVTLLGADAPTHDALTRVKGSFEATLAGVRLLEDAGLRVCIKSVVMKGNVEQIGEIRRLAQTLGDGSFRLDGLLMGAFAGGIDVEALRVPPERLVEVEEAYGNDAMESWCHEVDRLSGFERTRLYSCGAARRSAYLSPWGGLQPCLSAAHISHSLRGTTVHEAWRRLQADVSDRALPTDHACRGCTAFAFCQNCPAAACLDSGEERGVSNYRCAVAKAREKRYNRVKKTDEEQQ